MRKAGPASESSPPRSLVKLWRTVVGVVGNDHDDGITRPATTTVYWPVVVENLWTPGTQVQRSLGYAIRNDRFGSPTLLKEIQQAVWSINPNLPVANVQTLDEIQAKSMAQTSFALVMLSIAAAVALLLVVVCTALHLLVAGRVELSGDEAHYALYGYFLDWSYFDHPPLVGWLQALILPFSDSDFALRLWPAALGVLSSLALFRLTRTLFPDESPWTAFVAVALLQSALAFQVFSIAMEPDTVLLPLSLGAAVFLLRAVEHERASDWLWVGVLFGLAGLAKYTAVMLAVGALLLVLLGGRTRVLRRPGPWLAVAVADGHGGRPHFRSGRGSELAVEAGLQVARETAARLAAGATVPEALTAAKQFVHEGLVASAHWHLGAGHGPVGKF